MKNKSENNYRIGFDIGGTFTDFVLTDEKNGEIILNKCLTTPEDPSIGVLNGLNSILNENNLKFNNINNLVHGTTLVTNALIERKGASIALLTTKGFRDVLEFGHEQRYDIHDLYLKYPEPLVTRNLRFEVEERISRDGEIIIPIDMDQVKDTLSNIVRQGITTIAICFIHAYKNPIHEEMVRTLVFNEFDFLNVSISSDIHPKLREFERTTTTVANAYVQPLTSKYINRLKDNFINNLFKGEFHLMQSSGGLISPSSAIKYPIRLLESGPAGGAQFASYFGQLIKRLNLISFDMGGTTAKACLIQNGKADIAPMMETAREHRFKKGSGIPIEAPVIDMIEIGAGGGSRARIDQLGLLKVGPESSGANPGPACYGLGGIQATVTDANLVLGYINPEYFLGGQMLLNVNAAENALKVLADKLSMNISETAWGIYDIVCENMAAATRIHIVEKGRDPRSYALLAIGGAGPLHATHVAKKLGIGEVIIPPATGTASALGFLVAPISFDSSQSMPILLDDLQFQKTNELLKDLEDKGKEQIRNAGVNNNNIIIKRFADMRLFGQMHEITIALPDDKISKSNIKDIYKEFKKEYTRLYTELYEGAKIQILNWRVECSSAKPNINLSNSPNQLNNQNNLNQKEERLVYFPDESGYILTKILDRYSLPSGFHTKGPAIIEERESTTVLNPNDELFVDELLNLRIKINQKTKPGVIINNNFSFNDAVNKIESDPVGLEILWNRLVNITEECWETVIRTAFSLIIGEAQDFACEILDAKGNQLAHSPRAMPVFNITLPMAVNAMIERYPIDTLKPGDILITNDPWLCAGHLFDIAIAAPVFLNNKVVALMGVVGHVTDIGGTKDSLNAKEIYEEGIQIPPMKLYRGGKKSDDIFDLIHENVRNPDQVIGDLHALVSACRLGIERIKEFLIEYGMDDLQPLAHVVQNRAEKAMRESISKLPDGNYTGEIWNDGLGKPERFPIKINIAKDELEVDFSGAPQQSQIGAGNCTLSYTLAHTTYPLKCMLSPSVPGNAGCYRPLKLKVPNNSILNCSKPLAVNMRTRTGWYLASNIFNAMSKAASNQVQAFTGLPGSALFYGSDKSGNVYNDHLFQGGGQGAWHNGDGKSGILWPTSAGNTSIELFENRVPVIVLEKSLIPDSGGPGRYRGGLGQIIRVAKLFDDKRQVQVGLYPNGVMIPVEGLFDGKSGTLSGAFIFDKENNNEKNLGIGSLAFLKSKFDIAELRLSGGSGFGNPKDRTKNEIIQDLKYGYISLDGAKKDYFYIEI